ncbi:ElyC/SanA/YdcF family protein [Lactiplantibacillus fabifermentans]|uniref:DUF218 domain-containing protein n=2 Tax=Lactiplantibacillus fabifermentans TaxID=483011 RepID=A0A0R2NTU6_9LACO|nr:ElyC/SanA/YdcF family protein [Lactiplantibacillus fabifermentans]ETY72898.1 S-adenosyl-L-methionine binding protein [Lactiplantibacillus fabifermentans T30PCM01]KRO29097.1 hypothetical protein DY78_GL001506 [Lactiplantibacillus fabifermentans DSM 21115]
MTDLTALNQCLDWLTQPAPTLTNIDSLVLCGNSLPQTAEQAARLANQYHLPAIIIAGGIGHATKYLRQNLGLPANNEDEATIMSRLVRAAGYQGKLLLDSTSTNTGANARNALALAPKDWQHVMIVQDPLLARRSQLTFEQVWPTTVTFSRYLPPVLQLKQLQPLTFTTATRYDQAWPSAYFTELMLGELQRLHDTPQGYGPNGTGYIAHVDIPVVVLDAVQTLTQQHLNRER